MSRRTHRVAGALAATIAVALWTTGCGNPNEQTQGAAADSGGGFVDTGNGEGIVFQPKDTGSSPDADTSNSTTDGGGGGTDSTGGGTDGTGGGAQDGAGGSADTSGGTTCEGEGGFNCACKSNDDCDSGFCVEGPQGSVCSKTCVDSCPEGFKCAQTGKGADVTYLCAPTTTSLCQPCEKDKDCDHAGAEKGSAACLPMKGADGSVVGSFCSAKCGGGVACPSGFSCKELDLAGGKTQQCVPNPGTTCACNGWGISGKATTQCSTHNSAGTCWGERACTAKGLSLCSAATPTVEACNGVDDDCDGDTDEGITYDDAGTLKNLGQVCGSGACAGGLVVCKADGSGATCSSKSSGAKEVCNFKDDDCNGETDEGLTIDDADCVYKGVCTKATTKATCATGKWSCDFSAAPGYEADTETTCDGLDNNCDGSVDEAFTYGDKALTIGAPCQGVGTCGKGVVVCALNKKGATCSTNPDGPNSAAVTETCDGKDNDCDGLTDEGCDDDKDGYCDAGMTVVGSPAVCAKRKNDCDENAKPLNPGAKELCNDVDDDCDKSVDDGCDDDNDGYCDAKMVIVGKPKICTKGKADCNDLVAKIHPGGVEQCNDVDDDCNKTVDDGCDDDKDGYCDANMVVVGSPAVCGKGTNDCDDAAKAVNPGAKELCNDVDDDCNKTVDDGCDDDKDGYCDANMVVVGSPKICPKGKQDCNDKAAGINPGAKEICDSAQVDENCNGDTNDKNATKCVNFYKDIDKDGFGVTSTAVCVCRKINALNYTTQKAGDCDDGNKAVNPSAKETCATAYDDDCDKDSNDLNALKCVNFYVDTDDDNFGDKNKAPQCRCSSVPSKNLTAFKGKDCNDNNKAVNPGAKENCATPYDDNCNGNTNDIGATFCTPYYQDLDKDGYGAKGSKPTCLCKPNTTLKFTSLKSTDCNDGNPKIKPGIKDSCATVGVDDNCDGKVDPENSIGCKSFYYDGDKDGFGVGAKRCLCGPNASTKYTATKLTDCNDGASAVFPGAKEICNGIDDDCDKAKDENPDATKSCKPVSHATVACKTPKCAIASCTAGYFDIDKSYSNGCECGGDSNWGGKGQTCKDPIIGAKLVDVKKASATYSGNLMPGEPEQWYRVETVDAADISSCDNYNVKIYFTSNPGGVFQMDVYRGSCAASAQICKDEVKHEYRVDYRGAPYGPWSKAGTKQGKHYPTPSPIKAGECKCAPKGGIDMNQCANQSAFYYVRVHYKKGVAPVCKNFEIKFSNGVP